MRYRALLGLLLSAPLGACVDDAPTAIENAVVACEFGEPDQLAVGQTMVRSGPNQRFCVRGAQGATFLLVPFVGGARDTLSRVTVKVFGGGMADSLPVDVQLRPAADPLARELLRLWQGSAGMHALLNAQTRDLPRALPNTPRPAPPRGAQRMALPLPGDVLQFNVSTQCTVADHRAARVVAVTSHAIVAVDPENPVSGAFTDDELQAFALHFDQVVYPVMSENFGTPTDMDDNQRVVLFFTRAVNQIEIPGSPAALAGGFFWRGDLFPRAGSAITGPCAGSNEAEVLYLAVPDSLGQIRVPINRSTLMQTTSATIGHEYQHLLNTGRKLHVVGTTELEESWLNEGLSFIAEELLFYAASGFSPGTNIDTTAIYAAGVTDAFNKFMYGNMGRLNIYVQAPQDFSVLGRDGLPTRGAAWSFLRYIADRDQGPDRLLWRALIDGRTSGLDNIRNALGVDPTEWMRDWTLSIYADDFVEGSPDIYQQPSWKTRELIAALRPVDARYPLRLLPVFSGEGFSVRMLTGSAAYSIFAVGPNERAGIVLETEGATDQQQLHTMLMRVR